MFEFQALIISALMCSNQNNKDDTKHNTKMWQTILDVCLWLYCIHVYGVLRLEYIYIYNLAHVPYAHGVRVIDHELRLRWIYNCQIYSASWRWKNGQSAWKCHFEQYHTASKDEQQQVSALLYCLGEITEDVLDTTRITNDDKKKNDKGFEAFDNYF